MYKFKEITLSEVDEMCKWKYDGFMDTLYMQPYYDNYEEGKPLKGPANCDGFSVYKNGLLFGLFEYYDKGDFVEIGLALNPEYVGKGNSLTFIQSGIDFLIGHYKYVKDFVVLSVEKGNVAAYKAYLKFGFEEVKETEEEITMHYYL